MNLLGTKLYDPAVAVTKGTATAAMAAFDTTNLRISFTVPPSGVVRVVIQCVVHGATTFSTILLGVMEGAMVKGRVSPVGGLKTTAVATAMVTQRADFCVNGLTPGASLNWDAAWGIETFVASSLIKYGGPDNGTANDAYGALQFEIWDAAPNLAIADAVWDEALAGHATGGSAGATLTGAGSAGDPWGTALPGAYGSGTAGKIIGDNLNATVGSRATQTSVDDVPTNAELATALGTADDAVLAQVALVKAKTDNLPAAPASTTNITAAAGIAVSSLGANVITAASIAADAITAAKLAADVTTEVQTGLSTLTEAGVRTAVGLVSANLDTQLDALPTNAELGTALASADDPVLAAIAALNNLSQANIRTALGLATANLDTQLADLPTNSELAAALASADDATLAAVAALNNLSSGQVQTAVAAVLTAYDPPTRAEATADKDEVLTALGDVPTNAELTTALASADDATLSAITSATTPIESKLDLVDGVVDAIKTKTDQLTFTKANELDANMQSVNGVTIAGTGATGDEWGPE